MITSKWDFKILMIVSKWVTHVVSYVQLIFFIFLMSIGKKKRENVLYELAKGPSHLPNNFLVSLVFPSIGLIGSNPSCCGMCMV